MPLWGKKKPATPSKDKPDQEAAHHKTTHPHETYHVGQRKHVDRPYDKHSKLYHPDLWNWHDLYDKQLSYAGVVTRSQTAFNRIEIDTIHMRLFGDKALHHPHDLPHLLVTMKDGTYGALPRTILTRSLAQKLEMNPTLCKVVDIYKSLVPLEVETVEEQSRKPSLLKRLLSRKESTLEVVNEEIKNENTNDEEINESFPRYNVTEASPTTNGSVRFNEQHLQRTNPSLMWRPLIRESSFTLESLKHLYQPKASFSGVLKSPSFSLTPNYLFDAQGGFLEEDSQSRQEEDQFEKEEVNESFPHRTLTEASPTRIGSVRYNEQHEHGANPALSGKNTFLIRETTFSLEFLNNLPQPKALRVLKSPSFSVTPNSDTPEGSLEVESQSRREEDQGNQAPLPLVSSRGLKRLRSPSPDSRNFPKNRIKSPVQLPTQTTFLKFQVE